MPVSTAPKRGAAQIVRNTGDIAGQAETAAKAGVKLLLVVNDGVGRLNPWPAENPFSPEMPAPVTVATLGADEGEAPLRHPKTMSVTSHPGTGYPHDVVHQWAGAVPADPSFRSGPAKLANVEVTIGTTGRPRLWRAAATCGREPGTSLGSERQTGRPGQLRIPERV